MFLFFYLSLSLTTVNGFSLLSIDHKNCNKSGSSKNDFVMMFTNSLTRSFISQKIS